MTSLSALTLPDHTQLLESDGKFVKNLQEYPQSILLTDSIKPILELSYLEVTINLMRI